MKTGFNDKIITQSLCCWPQVLQRIINFKLTEHCFGYRDPFTQRCYRSTVLGIEIFYTEVL